MLPSVPSKQLKNTSTKSERRRNRIGCVSGSPRRQLNSMTRGCPAASIMSPAYREAAIVDAVGSEPAHGRQHDLAHDALVDRARDDGRRRVSAHAARVRAARSPSSRVLWSCELASGTTRVPSTTAMKLASSPTRNSSMTTVAPAWPNCRCRSTRSSAASASARVGAMMTPLPAASPSALMTIGGVRVAT